MKQRGKVRIAKLLALVMISAFLCGSTAMAQVDNDVFDCPYIEDVQAGSYIHAISVYDFDGSGKYLDYRFYINGDEYFLEDGAQRVDLKQARFEVTGVDRNDEDKTLHITGDRMIGIEGPDKNCIGRVKAGETVTINLSDNTDKKFGYWYVWVAEKTGNIRVYTKGEAISILGVPEEQWVNPSTTITFTVPSVWEEEQDNYVGFLPVYYDEDYDDSDKGTADSAPAPSASEGNGGGKSDQTSAAEPVVQNAVVLSDHTTLTSAGAMHNVATGINGAAVTTSQEAMNTGAGLSPQDVEAGVNAKFYIGNTYQTADKAMLTDAVAQLGANIYQMIDIDLYTIAKSGKIAPVRTLSGENPEAVRMVIGLPEGAAKQGGSFSLVTIDENGQVIEIPDLDSDPRTLTVDLTRFGSFAIVYR